jgi:hypothetical protein
MMSTTTETSEIAEKVALKHGVGSDWKILYRQGAWCEECISIKELYHNYSSSCKIIVETNVERECNEVQIHVVPKTREHLDHSVLFYTKPCWTINLKKYIPRFEKCEMCEYEGWECECCRNCEQVKEDCVCGKYYPYSAVSAGNTTLMVAIDRT